MTKNKEPKEKLLVDPKKLLTEAEKMRFAKILTRKGTI